MGDADYYKPGSWNVICDRCGKKRKANDVKKEWNGLWVCSEHWEARHPQDLVRGKKDSQKVPFSRPEGTDTFLGVTEVTTDDL